MAPLPHIELLARRQEDLQARYPADLCERAPGWPHLLSGRRHGRTEQWFWGGQGVFISMEIGQLHGHAPSFDHAKAQLRTAFDLWLAWTLAAPPSHLSYSRYGETCETLAQCEAPVQTNVVRPTAIIAMDTATGVQKLAPLSRHVWVWRG